MQKIKGKAVGVVLILVLMGFFSTQVQAAKGVPGSQEFAYGASLYANQNVQLDQAIRLLKDLNPDWIYAKVSWSDSFSSPEQADLSALDRVMEVAALNQTPVVIGLSSAPAWAMTAQGPDPEQTARLCLQLAERYPGLVQAFELFPRANTSLGWGTSADPGAYLNLIRIVRQVFQSENVPVVLVAGGLQPLSQTPAEGDINDLVFLQGLYDAGAIEWMPIVSLQFVELTGEPLNAPSDGEYRVLRHYEQVRRVMVSNQHLNGFLWITHVNLPNGRINAKDSVYSDPTRQAEWFKKAYIQLRSQLYIGAAFLTALNPVVDVEMVSMSRSDGSMHPFYPALKEMVAQNNKLGSFEKPGRPKDGNLVKLR